MLQQDDLTPEELMQEFTLREEFEHSISVDDEDDFSRDYEPSRDIDLECWTF